ncbi:MAG TPA: hypothetical protein VHY08_16255 [Bacillota bacterium]|nr:hypothetical protein [Bacillota bacterium]
MKGQALLVFFLFTLGSAFFLGGCGVTGILPTSKLRAEFLIEHYANNKVSAFASFKESEKPTYLDNCLLSPSDSLYCNGKPMAGLIELSVRLDAPAQDNKYLFRLVRKDEIIECALMIPAGVLHKK